MPSARKAAAARGGDNGELLKGSHLKANESSTKIFVLGARESPEEFSSPLILDIEENHGCLAFPLNKTNLAAMVDLIDDDYEKWIGYEVTLTRIKTTNPKTRAAAWGLQVTGAVKSKRKLPTAAKKAGEVPF